MNHAMRRLIALFKTGRGSSRVKKGAARHSTVTLSVEGLEERALLDASAVLSAGLLTVTGDSQQERILVTRDATSGDVVVKSHGQVVGDFANDQVNQITIAVGNGTNVLLVSQGVTQQTLIMAGTGRDIILGGGGPTTILAGDGHNLLFAGPGATTIQGGDGTNAFYAGAGTDTLVGGSGGNYFFRVKDADTVVANSTDPVHMASGQNRNASTTAVADPSSLDNPTPDPNVVLTPGEVQVLLQRASAASASDDGIVAIVDRNGNPLGIRVEKNVSPQITGSPQALTFAIDGALAEARTGAYFANNQAPLTSRTVQFISQSTITQREVDSNPNVPDPNSTVRGPGDVAPIGTKAHFPPNVPFTPTVDLFDIENTNRDSLLLPGADGIKGTADDIALTNRFNVPTPFAAQHIATPESYGFYSGIDPTAQARGIGTLPGGIPIYKTQDGTTALVGGIGVFFPGTTGYASAENSQLSSNYDPTRPDRSLEAEYDAFAAVGGAPGIGASVGALGGVAALPEISFPLTQQNQRIDLVGVTLDIVGPGGTQGPANLLSYAAAHFQQGDPNSGNNQILDPAGTTLKQGQIVPDGWLVAPHAGDGLTADDVRQIIAQGVAQAEATRAAIRLPLGSRTSMVFAVSDKEGNILGLYRMPDATFFSIAVAVAKSRNNAYYNDPNQLQPQDTLPGIAPGIALTSRTYRYLALPRYPEGQDGAPPGPFSILQDGGTDPNTGLNTGAPLPASAFNSVQGHNDFNPDTNFHDPFNLANQDGIVFFPGGVGLYKDVNGSGQRVLAGGLGVSGDGVDQDDVVTAAAANGYTPTSVLRADQVFFAGIRLPYQKFDRNPEG